jgi:hypothetical protein
MAQAVAQAVVLRPHEFRCAEEFHQGGSCRRGETSPREMLPRVSEAWARAARY